MCSFLFLCQKINYQRLICYLQLFIMISLLIVMQFLIGFFILDFRILQFATILRNACLALRSLVWSLTTNITRLHQRETRFCDMCDLYVMCAYHGHREITNRARAKSVWIRIAMDCCARSSARITLSLHNIVHGSRVSAHHSYRKPCNLMRRY